MLNNMKETTTGATALAALPTSPIAIAEEKHCNLYTTTTTKNTTKIITNQNSTPTKSKSIFNWLKSATKSFDSVANSQSQSQIYNDINTADTWNREGVTTLRAKSADTSLVNSYREFRGVQTLRHLWNKRISSANCQTGNTTKSIGNAKTKKLTKSVSCLVSAHSTNLYETAVNGVCDDENVDENDSVAKRRRYQATKRALSLHDCTKLECETEQAYNDDPNDIDFRLHCEKDNFYKYKTAEQASKHFTRDTKIKAKQLSKRLSAGIVSESAPESAVHFPAVTASAKGERIHWLRRDEVIVMTAKRDLHARDAGEGVVLLSTTNNEKKVTTMPNDNSGKQDADATPALHKNRSNNTNSNSSSENTDTVEDSTLTATNSPQCVRSFATNTLRRTTTNDTTASGSNSKRSSINSISSSSGGTTETGSPGGTTTRTRKHPATARRYSFKTHAKTYHPHRKMLHASKTQQGDGGSASNGAATGSIVAKLTQQFNEIIQKDKKLLQEVKRKNGVLLTRGGHVYKVVETTKGGGTQKITNSSTVRRTIKKFESGTEEKPQPPAKSLQVLRKREELVNNKNQQTGSQGNHNTRQGGLANGSSNNSNKLELKLELNKTTTSKLLEVVKEESVVKTPLEIEEKTFVDAANVGDELITINVSNSRYEDSTFRHAMQDEQHKNFINVGDNKANSVNQAEANGSANAVETTQKISKVVVAADKISNDVAETMETQKNKFHRLPPEGQEDVASNLEQQQQQQQQQQHNQQPQAEQNKEIFIMPTFPTATNRANDNYEVAVTLRNQQKSVNLTNSPQEELDAAAAVVTSEEKLKQRKHRYAKIYEKFRFRSPFSSSNGQNKKPTVSNNAITSPSRSNELKSSVVVKEETSKRLDNEEMAVATPTVYSDAKILDALEVIDQKLKGLSDEATAAITETKTSIVLCTNDDFEQRLLPNTSFVYQATTMKQVSDAQILVAQAVNVALVNNIEGEQLLKEQDLEFAEGNRQVVRVIEIPAMVQTQNNENTYREITKETKKPFHPKCDDTKAQVLAVTTNTTEESEEMYEPITPTAEKPKTEILNPQESFIFKRCKSEQLKEDAADSISNLTDDIYQTVEELREDITESAVMLDGYESIAGSSEAPPPPPLSPPPILLVTKTTTQQYYDGYEICEPPPDENQPVTPTLPSPTTYGATLVRNTNDELPALPEPKRRILSRSPLVCKKLPPTPTKCSTEITFPSTLPLPKAHFPLIDDNDDHHYYADDENIYDTIKGAHCYESLQATTVAAASSTTSIVKQSQKNSAKSLDTVSLTSNCYESITNYRLLATSNNAAVTAGQGCIPIPLRSAGSTSTISSDHKTNSLYEVSLAAGLLYNGSGTHGFSSSSSGDSHIRSGRSRTGSTHSSAGLITANVNKYSNSIAASSDNSDEWVDITDNEAEGEKVAGDDGAAIKQQFIVVRERSKVHRSPDWSKRVRDKRLQQKKSISCIEDDSDHYYESLSPLSNKRHSMHSTLQRSNSHHKRNQDLPLHALRASQRRQQQQHQHSASAHALGQRFSDDYDSFDTDTDEIYETEENHKNHNDSGVDIRNVKLPDPPPSTNQVYAMVKKLKNFISNKKSPNSTKYGGSQQKLYENSSQFYVEGNIYLNTPKSVNKSTKPSKPRKTTPTREEKEDYENTEFHSPPTLVASNATPLSTSDKNLNTHCSNTEIVQNGASSATTSATTPRSKSKSGKSFKSRLRKSLVGSTFDTKQLSVLTPTRSTFYIEDPSHGGSGELDSGFSEKASTGDLTAAINTAVVTPTVDSQKFNTVARKIKKESKSSNAQRRRTTIGMRPHEPPPPPPPSADGEVAMRIKSRNTASTFWYAECGVFKNGTSLNDEHSSLMNGNGMSGGKRDSQSQHSLLGVGSTTSWYAEAGLYQTSGESVASSSGSSGVSTGNEAGLGDDMPHSMFQNEPLYQIYSAAKLQSLSRDMEDQDGGSTDGYEEIGQHGGSGGDASTLEDCQKRSRPTALQLVGPKSGPSRTLWSEITEVINSCILPTLTPRERGFQEAKFEIITSEASYLKSLNLLRSHFMNHPVFRDTTVVSARDRKALFSHIVPVHECSERLLTALESCWQDNIMLLGLSKSIYAIAEKHFHVYISFCEHQGRMDRTLRRLKESKGSIFSQNLDLLESSPTCCGLNLHSFLMLPMQRITRLPLLIDAVFSKAHPNDDEYDSWKMTLAIMNKIVTQCNEAANRCEQAYEIERIARQLEFPISIRSLAIAPAGMAAPGSKPRFLVKKGELTHLIWRGDDAKLTFGKKFTKTAIYAFLFSDLLVLTKRRSEEQFLVFDYCPRNMLTISSGDLLPQLPTKDINQTGKNLILMTLLENHERKTIELVLSCPSVSEQERWLQAMRPPEAETPGEKLYEQWDCPQVVAKHAYVSKEPDALGLEIGDVVNVSRKLPDGWYQGERIRDGVIGWFPGNFTEEVNSAHVRARNLKQRYRLLTFTATYLESQKRK